MLIELDRVEVGYHARAILPPVTLRIETGAFIGIVGPNGSGKTTLVRTVLGLLRPVSGSVRYGQGRPRVGYVPQRDQTDRSWPLTTYEVVLMGRYPRIGVARRPSKADRDATLAALAHVGAEDLANRPFDALSGGQRQRVLTARALCGEPEILVLDEPTSGMDLVAEHAMLELISRFPAERIAVIMVSHQLAAVAGYVRDLLIVDRDRFLVESGPALEVLTSERLSALYKTPVEVAKVDGHKTVFVKPAERGSQS